MNLKRLDNYFDKIYCVNLDRRVDKWSKVSKYFTKMGIDVTRFSAIDGRELPNSDINFIGLNNGEIGCILSHLDIYKDVINKGYERVLILEDDIIPHKNIIDLFENKKDKFDLYDLVFLGSNQGYFNRLNINDDYMSNDATWGSFAYSPSVDVMKYLLNMEVISSPIDNIINKFNALVLYPQLFIADVSESDIREKRDINVLGRERGWSLENYDY